MSVNNPWFIGAAGTLHPAEVARVLASAATGGGMGVVGVTDFKASQLTTPGGGILVNPGAVVMPSRYPGGERQSYVGWEPVQKTISVDPTAGAGRSDMLIARIRDPQYGTYAGWNPAAPNDFTFFSLEVVKSVPAGAKTLTVAYPYAPLYRIDIPSSTTNITNAMMVDIREKYLAQVKTAVKVAVPSGDLNVKTSSYQQWPSGTTPVTFVPSWATRLTLIATFSGIEVTGPVVVGTRGALGTVVDTNTGIIYKAAAGTDRQSFTHISTFAIPSNYRGTDVPFSVQAQRTSSGGNAQLDYQTTIAYQLQFEEVPE